MTTVLVLSIFLLLTISCSAVRYIYSNAPEKSIAHARKVGEYARRRFVREVATVLPDDTNRNRTHELYLDGLAECSKLGHNLIDRFVDAIENETNLARYSLLKSIGIDDFSAKFFTISPKLMSQVVHSVCTKQEMQLQCGEMFEGSEILQQRANELRHSEGNYKQMFDYECKDGEYVPTTYPCIGENVQKWTSECTNSISEYQQISRIANLQIEEYLHIAGNVLQSAQNLQTTREFTMGIAEQMLEHIVRKISAIEGTKCAKYHAMSSCLTAALERSCGNRSALALETTLNIGYLRHQRTDIHRNLFEIFAHTADEQCLALL